MSDALSKKKGLGAAAVGLLLLGINHYAVMELNSTLQILAVGGPAFLALGLAGIAEPRIMEAMDKSKRATQPTWAFVAGIAATAAGVGLGFWLAIGYYGLEF